MTPSEQLRFLRPFCEALCPAVSTVTVTVKAAAKTDVGLGKTTVLAAVLTLTATLAVWGIVTRVCADSAISERKKAGSTALEPVNLPKPPLVEDKLPVETGKITENLESCAVDWRIKSYKALLASWTEAGDGFAYRSPPFLGNRWRLSIENVAGNWGVFLEAGEPVVNRPADYERRGEYLWSFEAIAPSAVMLWSASSAAPSLYDAHMSSWGCHGEGSEGNNPFEHPAVLAEDYFTIRVVLLKVSPNGRIPYTPDDLLPLANLGVSEAYTYSWDVLEFKHFLEQGGHRCSGDAFCLNLSAKERFYETGVRWRRGTFHISVDIVSPEGQRLVALSATASFDYAESRCSWSDLDLAVLRCTSVVAEGFFRIECSLTRAPSAREVEPVTQVTYSPSPVVSAPPPVAPIPAPRPPSPAPSFPYASSCVRDSLYSEVFNNPEECDTVFEVSLPSGKVGYIFTLKELLVKDSQHFAQLLASAERDFQLDPSVSLDVDASDRFNPAEDMWWHLRKCEDAEGDALDEEPVSLEDLSEASGGDSLSSLVGEGDVLVAMSAAAHGVSSDQRLYFRVKTEENDWLSYNTVLAVVYYLHFGTVSFAKSPALALAADPAAPFLPLTPNTTRKGADQHSSAPLCLAQVVVGLTSADGWDLPSLCKLAVQDVVSQLTVESAAYELFSVAGTAEFCITGPSSSSFSAFPLLRMDWSAIQASAAWQHCVALSENGKRMYGCDARLRILEALANVEDP